MNIEKINACVKYFEEEPLRLNMAQWLKPDLDKRDEYDQNILCPGGVLPDCGVVGCIAGTAALLEATEQKVSVKNLLENFRAKDLYTTDETIRDFATHVLELTHDQRERLFFVANWPTQFRTPYEVWSDALLDVCHPHIAMFIKSHMVDILRIRVESFIMTDGEY